MKRTRTFSRLLALPLALTLSLSFLVSCMPRSSDRAGRQRSWLQQLAEDVGIFSNRSEPAGQFIAILKFKTPALLATSSLDKGQVKIDAEQLKALLAEQEQALKEIKELSSEIRVLYRYKLVLNGIAVVAPTSLLEKLKALASISYIESGGQFDRPRFRMNEVAKTISEDLLAANSVKFIGAEKLHERKISGQGVKVGIIDTGIDYTHAMLGGPGTEEIYKSVDPSRPTILFPNKKVVGGIDLVGTKFDTASPNFSRHIPVPDENPLDEAGHGSHVAGTVAGLGDGVNTYSGVAPDADLYAIKVFGAEGSTGDEVVIAGLEYAADPSNKGTAEGRLDVVNLSLGSPWGAAHLLYGEAIKNLVAGGTVVVASAGNEGPVDYIVGAPSIVDEALSVAASVDNSVHNWEFSAVKFKTPTKGDLVVEAIEGSISKAISEAGPISGRLVEAGLAAEDFSQELQDKIKGNIALISRGKVNFTEKIRRAFEAGALGVVVVQNQPGKPFAMGGDGKYAIPAIMISQGIGDTLREEMKLGEVTLDFQTPEKIQKPELIDTLTDFSSKGPRSIDGFIKPEISAPGANVISAAMGKGTKGMQMSGTSMAGPHVAGAMALLRQALPTLTPLELKAVAMGRSVSIADEEKVSYPISQQGAGRIQIDRAAESVVVADVAALSLGEMGIESKKMVRRKFKLKNISTVTQELQVDFITSSKFIEMSGTSNLVVAAGESANVSLSFLIDASQFKDTSGELDGLVRITKNGQEVYRLPVLAVAHKVSQVNVLELAVHSTSAAAAAGAAADLKLNNKGLNSGDVLLFNLLGRDQRKQDPKNDQYLSKACDLQAAGYRVIEKTVDGNKVRVLQVAAKLYEPLTTWNTCEVSLLIDGDGDGQADQELAGIALGAVKGLATPGQDNKFVSVLLDSAKARQIRKEFELASNAALQEEAKPADPNKDPKKDPKPEIKEDYSPAVLDMQAMTPYLHSTIAIIEADISKLARSATGELSIKMATIHEDSGAVEMDDYLGKGLNKWRKLSVDGQSQSFVNLPEVFAVAAGEEKSIEMTKGEGAEDLLVLLPQNRSVFSDVLTDNQGPSVREKYSLP